MQTQNIVSKRTRHSLAVGAGASENEDELSAVTSLFWSFVPYHAARVAIQSGLFDELAQHGQLSREELAFRMGWKSRPTYCLLDVLETLGLVHSNETGIGLTRCALRWFVRSSPSYVGRYFERTSLLEKAYQSLETYLAADSPDPLLQAATLKAFGLSAGATVQDVSEFGQILNATSTPVAQAFFRLVSIPKDAAVLDVGAGAGVFIRKLLDNGHQGSIDFLDTPFVCDVVKPNLSDCAERVQWLPVDWHLWQPSNIYDAVFLHHVLHEEKQADAERLLRKCASTLAPHGTLYVVGLFENENDINYLARYFGMNVLLEVGGDNTRLEWLRSVASETDLHERIVRALPGGRTLWAAARSQS